jgi:hypothetical protein
MSALGRALIHQWCDEYMTYAYPRGAPHECGRVRTYLFRGFNRFQMRQFVRWIHMLLEISVFLFFWAISDFFYMINPTVGTVSRYCLVAALVVSMTLSISPLIFPDSPYHTPLTNPLGAIGIHSLHCYRNVLWRLQRRRSAGCGPQNPYTRRVRFDKGHLILREAEKRAENLDRYAMEWLLTNNDLSDDDMYKFLEGLPGYISSRRTKQDQLDQYLTAEPILDRIREHFLTCATSLELSEEESTSRVLSCVKSLRLIFQHGIRPYQTPSEADKERLRRQMTYVEDIIEDFGTLCDRSFKDPIVALRSSCVRALAVQGLLTQLAHSEGGMPPNQQFPISLIPLYTFFFPNDNRRTIQQVRDGHSLNHEENEETKKMWKALLSDGPLINLTKLAEAVRSRDDAPPSSLSFCWKVLERLVKQLGIAVTKVSDETERSINSVYDSISEYVQTAERGFRISPLLDILDVVIRGRRLVLAFSNHPEYHSRADLLFEKEHLRNADLLESFARCLPDYIASIPKKREKFMEDMVCKDDLWTSLQVNLWNAQRSDRPTPDKLRVFEDCLTVLDVAFSSLEGSTKVDWRAPEFGSLFHCFESFITHCFKDSFMGRATSFHVGMIRARCSKALLTQFHGDTERDGTIFFRSQWDVASLARLFCGLSIGDGKDSDVQFWKSYVNGGHIGPEFTAKARETIHRTARDGPLLIFYNLGYLATTAVPLDGSGLGPKDLEKVWELLGNMIENERPALDRASIHVREKLGTLRGEVSHLRDKLSNEDRDRLQPLLTMIDVVCTPASKELSSSSSEHSPAEGPVTPASHLREQRGSISRSSFSCDSTVVTGGRSGTTSTSGDNSGGASSQSVSRVSLTNCRLTCKQTLLRTLFSILRRPLRRRCPPPTTKISSLVLSRYSFRL